MYVVRSDNVWLRVVALSCAYGWRISLTHSLTYSQYSMLQYVVDRTAGGVSRYVTTGRVIIYS